MGRRPDRFLKPVKSPTKRGYTRKPENRRIFAHLKGNGYYSKSLSRLSFLDHPIFYRIVGLSFSEESKLANTASAKKRIRSSERRRVRNRVVRSAGRTYVKKARTLIAAGKSQDAEEAVRQAISQLDKAAAKHVIHPRNAARRKGRLMAALAAARKA